MKTLKKIKLNAISENNLENREMNALRGGTVCMASCYWADKGGSSSVVNSNANYEKGYYSKEGDNCYWTSDTTGNIITYCVCD